MNEYVKIGRGRSERVSKNDKKGERRVTSNTGRSLSETVLVTKILSMLNKSMINSMLPFSMLSSCRCYSFDDNFFEVDVPVFDFTYFSPYYFITSRRFFTNCISKKFSWFLSFK